MALSYGPAAIGPLKVWRLSLIDGAMLFMSVHLLRARFFVLALAVALVGQIFAPFAMAMPTYNASMVGMWLTPSGMCPDCKDMDHSKAIGSNCSVGLCSGVMAILPNLAAIDAIPSASIPRAAHNRSLGITTQPDTGPPRSLTSV
jgi:hypothetical protein